MGIHSNYLLKAKRRVEAVIFDMDDTVVSWENAELHWRDYIKPILVAVCVVVEKESAQVIPDFQQLHSTFLETIKDSWKNAHETLYGVSLAGALYQTLERIGIDVGRIDIQALIHNLPWTPMPGVAAFEDTRTVLELLRSQGYKIGLITNSLQPMWMREVELIAFGIDHCFDAMITSGDTGYIKPHPAVFWRMLGMLNTRPNHAIFVGDSLLHDVRGANEVGMTSVWFRPPHLKKSAEDPSIIPDYTIQSLSQLLPIIETINAD